MAKETKTKRVSTAKRKAAKSVTLKRTSNADAKGRLVLGPRFANKMFRVSEQPNGNLLLEPVVAVHEREAWLYLNPEAQAFVQEGIKQSREGKGKYLGSFAEYVDEEE